MPPDIEKRFKHGELYSADSIRFADSLKCQTLRRHRTVFGGGGIMPDDFVPLDTTQFTALHRALVARSLIINATLRYTDEHRKELRQKYASFDDFNANFQIPAYVTDSIMAEAAKANVKPKEHVCMSRLQLKALVARDIWDMNEYYRIMNEENRIVRRAVETIKEWNKF